MAGRSGALYAGTSAANVHSKVPDTDAPGGGREGGQELTGAEPELLRDDRRVGLDDEVEPVEPVVLGDDP